MLPRKVVRKASATKARGKDKGKGRAIETNDDAGEVEVIDGANPAPASQFRVETG
jgi:hypothetical protein